MCCVTGEPEEKLKEKLFLTFLCISLPVDFFGLPPAMFWGNPGGNLGWGYNCCWIHPAPGSPGRPKPSCSTLTTHPLSAQYQLGALLEHGTTSHSLWQPHYMHCWCGCWASSPGFQLMDRMFCQQKAQIWLGHNFKYLAWATLSITLILIWQHSG